MAILRAGIDSEAEKKRENQKQSNKKNYDGAALAGIVT
jgi:hypothetical protein